MRRFWIFGGLALLLAGCDANQGEIIALRAQVDRSQTEISNLKQSTSTELSALRERVGQLEARPAIAEAPRSPPPPTGNDAETIKRVIADCVRKVRSLETKPASEAYSGRPYAEFDAFYNPGNSRVENNNRYVDQGPNYAFNKCMTSKGVPLTN